MNKYQQDIFISVQMIYINSCTFTSIFSANFLLYRYIYILRSMVDLLVRAYVSDVIGR